MLCEYGCGKEASHKQSNGKMCCSPFYSQCKNIRTKNKYSFSNEKKAKLLLIREMIRILKYKNKPDLCEYGCGKKAKYFY